MSLQRSDASEEVTSLQNHVAELEEEKGNLQLRLVDFEETLAQQGEVMYHYMLSCH